MTGNHEDHCPYRPASAASLLNENLMAYADAAKTLPAVRGKRPPCPQTIARWVNEGRRSKGGVIVYLESCPIGGTNCTSTEALARFFDRLNDAEPAAAPLSRSQAALKTQAAEAEKILRQRGLIK